MNERDLVLANNNSHMERQTITNLTTPGQRTGPIYRCTVSSIGSCPHQVESAQFGGIECRVKGILRLRWDFPTNEMTEVRRCLFISQDP